MSVRKTIYRCWPQVAAFPIPGVFAAVLVLLLSGSPAAAKTPPADLTAAEQKVVYQAQQAMGEKDYAAARQILTSFMEEHPRGVHYRVEFTMGNALSMAGETMAALCHYRAAADLYPDDAAVWQNMGKACYELKHYSVAGDSLAKAYALMTPKSPPVAYHAAVAYMLAGKPTAARPHLERLVSGAAGPPKSAWLEALLKVYLDLGHREKALKRVRDLLHKDGNNPRLWRILTRLYIDRGEHKNAAAALEVYSSLTPASKKEIKLLGDLYQMANVPLKAARQYEKMIAIDAEPAEYENAASAYIAARRPEKAIDVLSRGLERQPTSAMWWILGTVYYEKEAFQKAYQAFGKSTQNDPKNAGAHLMTGYCALQLDNIPAAKNAFIQAARFPEQRGEAVKMLKKIDKLQIASSKEVMKRQLP